MNGYRPAKMRITVSVGESVRIIRELQGLSQNQLSELTGIPPATISTIDNDRVQLGVERAKILAKVLKVHPGVLVFPGYVQGLWSSYNLFKLYHKTALSHSLKLAPAPSRVKTINRTIDNIFNRKSRKKAEFVPKPTLFLNWEACGPPLIASTVRMSRLI